MRNAALLAMLALPACAATPPTGELPSANVCHGEGLSRFVGKPATQELGADMLRESGARIIRWVGHGMVVTMDFSPQRLSAFLTADNRVERANCG